MRVNKVAPFYTEQDRIALAGYDRKLDKILEDAGELTTEMQAAQEAGDKELLKELTTSSRALWLERFEPLDNARNELLRAIEQRYIEAFNGDIAAILEDVREIVAATDKEEYIASQKRTTAELKPLLENKPTKDSSKEEKDRYRSVKKLSIKGYENCYYFILERVRVQLNALYFYQSEDGTAQAIAIVEDRAGSFYTKPKGVKTERKPIKESSSSHAQSGKILKNP